MLQSCQSIKAACGLLGLKWDAAHRIMERAVERGLARREAVPIENLGFDEKSFGRGQSYISLMNNLDEHCVIEVTQGNDLQSASALWQTLTPEQCSTVEAAAMDMSASFISATETAAPQAKIVPDKFHVSQMLNTAVDLVRREEHRHLQAEGDDRLKHTRYDWLYDVGQFSDERYAEFKKLVRINFKTSRAWARKAMFADFWRQPTPARAKGFFNRWYASAIRSRLEPLKKVARSLKSHLPHLLNYCLHPITNGLSEGLNSRIQQLKSCARGFRSFANYRIRILFYCGKLDLMPTLRSSAPGIL